MKLARLAEQIVPLTNLRGLRTTHPWPSHGIVFPRISRRNSVPSGQGNAEFNDLLNRVKHERCEASFKALFDHFYPKVLSFFQASVQGPKALDLAQETLLAIWHKASFFDSSKGACSTWIFTIARNLRYDHFRAHARDMLSIGAEDLYDQTADPAFAWDERILAGYVRAHINSLPAEQRDAVQATYFEGYSHGEYAQLRKIPLGTVKSRIRLALAHLKKGMEES
jgi:RNA polymerase sigma-70 factor (ECF subfamily)